MIEGVIAARARAIFPSTWDALEKAYGDSLLQSAIDLSKQSVFGVVVSPVLETQYQIVAVDYVAKLAVIELITPAIDYWMSMPISVSVQGSAEEVETVTDRAVRLQELRKQLVEETRANASLVEDLIGVRKVNRRPPLMNTLEDDFLTPSPQELPRPFVKTDRS